MIRAAVLLPGRGDHREYLASHNRLELVLPAIELAATDWTGTVPGTLASILGPGWTMEVLPGDTRCSSTFGPLWAFDLHCEAGKRTRLLYRPEPIALCDPEIWRQSNWTRKCVSRSQSLPTHPSPHCKKVLFHEGSAKTERVCFGRGEKREKKKKSYLFIGSNFVGREC